MPALLELQRAFVGALLREYDRGVWSYIVDDGFSAPERLRIYRNTCRSTLVQTLRMTYPAVERLVGRDFFNHAAAKCVARYPARSGYLNDYGGEFADFLAGFEPARELAYLPDVARFEWALSVAANAEDAPLLEPDALLGVQAEDHAALRFAPHPSVSCLELAYPADEIADAVLSGDEAAMAQVDLAYGSVCIVVHRSPNGLETERLCARSYEFVSLLCAGEPLGRVIEAAPEQAPMLLARQLAKGRLSAFRAPA
ncbi:MAG TPA: DNA-binding domain-containing protein [Burkholderiales bacterium]